MHQVLSSFKYLCFKCANLSSSVFTNTFASENSVSNFFFGRKCDHFSTQETLSFCVGCKHFSNIFQIPISSLTIQVEGFVCENRLQ